MTDTPRMTPQTDYEYVKAKLMEPWPREMVTLEAGVVDFWGDTDYSKARAWIDQREREIAELKEQIDYASAFLLLPGGKFHPVWKRTVDFLTTHLAEMQKGFRER